MQRDVSVEHGLRLDLVAPLVCDLLAAGASPEVPVRGNSMRPMLRDGDRVRLAPLTHAGAQLGDVVLRVGPSGPIIHRVVGWWPSRDGWRLLTKGDGARRLDSPLPPAGLVGRVVARVRGNSVRQFEGPAMRLHAWSRAFRSLMAGLVVEAWDRARGRARSNGY
jgi:signal peptidase